MAPARTDWDAIVIGLGAIGSAAAYWLSRSLGDRVLGLEQFELGNPYGASADHSRIIRLSYHRPDYVRLARRAYETWAAVEAESGRRIVTQTGGLDLWPAYAAIPMVNYTQSLEADRVPFDIIDAAEIAQRWPQWRLSDDVVGLWQAQGGLADPYAGNAAHRELAVGNGATLLDRTRVDRIRARPSGEVELDVGGVTLSTGRLILAVDAWINDLLAGVDMNLPVTVTKEQVTYFACPDPAAFSPNRFPVWIWMDDPCYYGFPTYGEAGPKVAQDCGGPVTTTATRTFERDEPAYLRVVDFVQDRLPEALGPPIYTKTCLYTLPPDRDFVVDRLPQHPGILVGLGAGHAFKYASVLGRILSELAVDGSTPSAGELEAFKIDRPALVEPGAPISWIV